MKKLISGLGDGIEFISSVGWLSTALISIGMVSNLAKHLNEINSLPNLDNIESKTTAICTAADKVINSITIKPNDVKTTNTRLNILERFIKTLNDNAFSSENAKNTEKVLNNYVTFVDKVNAVEVKKLENATNMFKQMSNFSHSIKGDFDKLAESLSEKLLPVLEELKEIMGVLPEKIDVGFQNTSASIAATNAPVTRENVTAQTLRENPSMTPEQVKQEVDARLNERAKADSNGVTSKLDELISLLKGYSGEYAVIQTV